MSLSNKTKVIIDCDPGCDDTIALIAALSSSKIEVLGCSSIGGNVDPFKTQKNILGICALMGRTDIPVYSGCVRPLKKGILITAEEVHGETGIQGLVLPFHKAAKACTNMDAADFILRKTNDHKHDPITLVVIGPMTNIALAYQRDPSLVHRVKEIVTMGGAYGNPNGNITPYAEFNIFCDPHAAKIVYDNFYNIRALPLDVTHQTLQDKSFRSWLTTQGNHGQNLSSMLDAYAETYPGMDKPDASPLHDFHTIAAILNPSLYGEERGKVSVTVSGQKEGHTTLARQNNGNTRVMKTVRPKQFFSILQTLMVKGMK